MTRGVQTQLTEEAKRLLEWCDGIQLSARLGFPIYKNPSELKADVRALADAYLALVEAARRYRQLQGDVEAAQGAHAPVEDLVVQLGYAALDLDAAVSVGSPETRPPDAT